MELQTTMKQINTIDTVFDDFDERPVDCDFVLPEYLPDIAAVLKCIMKPVVQTHQVSGDRIMADGTVWLQILYLDEDRKCVRSFENTQPFTSVFTVKEISSNCHIQLATKVNYVNCRATSPRRVDVHGAFSVKLTVTGERERTIVESTDCESICTQNQTVGYSKPVAFAQKAFSINEVLELVGGNQAEMLIRTEAVPCITDCKIMMGKVVVKGEILLKTVYATDTVAGVLGCSENTILFSQIIDAEGLDEEGLCSCKASLLFCEVHPTQNPGGENKLLSLSAKILITVQAYRTEFCNLISDAYHTRFPLKTEKTRVALSRITKITQDTIKTPVTVELPDADIHDVIDLWCEITSADGRCEKENSFTDNKLLVCMLTRDENGVLSYYERPVDFTLTHTETAECMLPTVTVLKTEYRISGKTVDLQLTVGVDRLYTESDDCTAICAMSADDTAPYTQEEGMDRCCMKIYFASAGETIWDIAKAEHISVDDIYAENNLTENILTEDTMLLLTL